MGDQVNPTIVDKEDLPQIERWRTSFEGIELVGPQYKTGMFGIPRPDCWVVDDDELPAPKTCRLAHSEHALIIPDHCEQNPVHTRDLAS